MLQLSRRSRSMAGLLGSEPGGALMDAAYAGRTGCRKRPWLGICAKCRRPAVCAAGRRDVTSRLLLRGLEFLVDQPERELDGLALTAGRGRVEAVLAVDDQGRRALDLIGDRAFAALGQIAFDDERLCRADEVLRVDAVAGVEAAEVLDR